ncbi:hypothetical protein Tco_0279320, partial [Tanacetum coccineum]
EYGISEDLHPELHAPGDRIVDFLEDKIGVYTKFFEFANFCIPISLLRFYQIDLSQLSVIGASKDEKPAEGSYSVEDPNPKIARSPAMFSRIEPEILPGRRCVVCA